MRLSILPFMEDALVTDFDSSFASWKHKKIANMRQLHHEDRIWLSFTVCQWICLLYLFSSCTGKNIYNFPLEIYELVIYNFPKIKRYTDN